MRRHEKRGKPKRLKSYSLDQSGEETTITEQASTRLFSERAQPFKDVPSKRELLQSEESIRVLHWGDIPSPNYRARLVAPQSTGGLE
jgi:hypothetical protein